MSDVLTYNPEAQAQSKSKWYKNLGKKLMSLGKAKESPVATTEERSPWAPTPREEMSAEQRQTEDARAAEREARIAREADTIAAKVTTEYADPNSVYNQRVRSAEAHREIAANEVLDPHGSIENASRHTQQARQQLEFGNQQVRNTFTSSKNEVTKQDVMDALHRQAINEDAQRASGDFVEPVATGRMEPTKPSIPTYGDPAENYFNGREQGLPVAGANENHGTGGNQDSKA